MRDHRIVTCLIFPELSKESEENVILKLGNYWRLAFCIAWASTMIFYSFKIVFILRVFISISDRLLLALISQSISKEHTSLYSILFTGKPVSDMIFLATSPCVLYVSFLGIQFSHHNRMEWLTNQPRPYHVPNQCPGLSRRAYFCQWTVFWWPRPSTVQSWKRLWWIVGLWRYDHNTRALDLPTSWARSQKV